MLLLAVCVLRILMVKSVKNKIHISRSHFKGFERIYPQESTKAVLLAFQVLVELLARKQHYLECE
jgi:hypothetical protein